MSTYSVLNIASLVLSVWVIFKELSWLSKSEVAIVLMLLAIATAMNAIANLIKDFNKANEKQEDKKDELTEPETTPASTPVYPEKETWEPVKDSDAPTDVCNLLQAAPPSRITWPKDGAEMVHILAGSFEMGDGKNESEDWMKWSRPVHPVELDGFYIDAYEVTVGQ